MIRDVTLIGLSQQSYIFETIANIPTYEKLN